MRVTRLFFIFLLISAGAFAQSTNKKIIQATRINKSPKIDGVLDDDIWIDKPLATDFIQQFPYQDKQATFRSEVKIVYNDEAVYIGAMLYDSSPDSVLRELSLRDNIGNADWFSIAFDTYFDQQNETVFGVTASGVQFDRRSNVTNFDAIWESEVKVNSEGWVVEMKIPYAALRFPKKEIQQWGVNMERNIRRYREKDMWQYIPRDVQNYVAYFGVLEGISEIKDPIRLSFTPYLGTTVAHYPYNIPGKSNFSSSYNAGLDLKYGINESFTLDMTLAPDFGQVQSDNQVLNLSAFEVEFQENRPFFIEGTELFNINKLFYARRIGGIPKKFFDVDAYNDDSLSTYNINENPGQVQLINATKISGRSPNGLGVGFLNAVTAEMSASVKNKFTGKDSVIVTEPLTNYNVVAVNRTLENNSYVSIINTNVTRAGEKDNANVSAVDFAIGDKKNRFNWGGFGAFSQKTYQDSVDDGFKYAISFSKVSGNLKYGIERVIENDTYNPNDLGILFSADEVTTSTWVQYNKYDPGKVLLNWGMNINAYYSTTYKTKHFQEFTIGYNYWHTYKNFLSQWFYAGTRPVEKYDYYEARTSGRVYKAPTYMEVFTGFSSDYRKKIALDGNVGYSRNYTGDIVFWEVGYSPIIRISDKFKFIYSFYFNNDKGQGYADSNDTTIYFGIRNVRNHTNTFNITYIFTPNSSLTFRARHYWSYVNIKKYKTLALDGSLEEDITNYHENNNVNVNFFNVDLIYRWRFAPGSDLIFVWKNHVHSSSDNLYIRRRTGNRLADNFYNTLTSDQTNTFTLKILYYLDYRYLQRNKKV